MRSVLQNVVLDHFSACSVQEELEHGRYQKPLSQAEDKSGTI